MPVVHWIPVKAVFLDRDGVIVENRPAYIKSWDDVEFLPGSLDALRRLAASPYAVVIVTNQSAVGRGIVSLEQAESIHRRIVAEIVRQGGRIDASYLCPHSPLDGCSCRKPAPGLLLQAAKDLGLDLPHSYLVGDALSDLQAAQAAGVRGFLVLTGRGAAQAALGGLSPETGNSVVADLSEAVARILLH
jgi:D-glycero-D-manno-heptose 1,7-bisphosphate phosphatase